MKVTSLKIYVVDSGSRRPIIVQLKTDSGVTGVGEAGIAYGVGAEAVASTVRELAQRFVLGRDASCIEARWNEMYDHSFWAKGGGAFIFAAISALEHALWDIKGKLLGVPVYELLGGKVRDSVPVYANGWWSQCNTADDFARATQAMLKEGYTALKLYPFAQYNDQITLSHPSLRTLTDAQLRIAYERVKAVRDTAGPDVKILLDLSGGLSTEETIRFCKRVAPLDIAYIEEPTDPFNVDSLQRIAQATGIAIALGERVYTRYGFHTALKSQAVDIVQPDPCNTGGIFETRKIAALAEIFGARVAPHNCASELSTAICLQLDACIPNFMMQEFFPCFPREEQYVDFLDDAPARHVRDGRLPIPTAPGLGVELIDAVISRYLWTEVTHQ